MCLFFSCNGNKVVVSDSIMIACEKNGEEIKISDFATKACLLPLETTEASLFGCHIRYFTENEDLILFIFFDKGQPQVSVYYKKTKKGYTCHYSDFKDDFYNIEGVLFSYQAGPNKMIAVLPAMMVLDQLNDAGKKILTNHNITEDSNPILYIIDTN